MFQRIVIWWAKRNLRNWCCRLSASCTGIQKRLISSKDVATDLEFQSISPENLTYALLELVDEGFLKHYYRLIKPDGDTLDWLFSDPRDIPDKLYDKASQKEIETAPMDIESVFLVDPYVCK
jgi:hypothetical protein